MMSAVWLITAIAAWGVVHSLLASLGAKGAFQRRLGRGPMRLYRLAYNLIAVVSLLPVLWLLRVLPDQPLYRVPAPWSYLMLAGQGLAALLLLAGVLQTDTLSFVGLRQILERERSSRLVTRGLYRYVRHPLYSAGLLLLWLTPVMSVNLFTAYLGLTAYILIGAAFEERKLLREFGSEYSDYRSKTPMLIPGLRSPE
jgi:protein-S-isoprenylcysteine O-methyltransferase Ste14